MNATTTSIHHAAFIRKGLFLAAAAACLGAMAPQAGAADPTPGKYSGKTGSTGRISFKVNKRGNKITNLRISIFALGQDTYGNVTEFQVLASNTDRRKFRLKRNGNFVAKGQDAKGIRYKVTGKLKGRRKFKGTVEMSHFKVNRYEYDPVFGSVPVYELVSGSRPYRAKR